MNNIQRTMLRTAAAAAIIGLGAPAFAAEYSANIELNNTYRGDREVDDVTTLKRGMEQDGRVEFNASGKLGEDLFAAGKGTFLAKKDGTCAIDDMWFQLGNRSFDVKMGRFEAYNLFPTPGDVLLDHAQYDPANAAVVTVYQANLLRGRKGNANAYGQGQFHAAGTFKSNSGLALELGVVEFEQTEDAKYATSTDAVKGLRPVLSYTADALSLAAGIELIKYSNGSRETGFGATAAYDFGAVKLNANAAFGKDDSDAPGHSARRMTTFGLMAAADFGLTGGVILAKNDQDSGLEDGKITTVYASYTRSLFDIKGATWSLGVNASTAGGYYEDRVADEKGMRLRFNYTF